MKISSPAKINLFLYITGRRDDGYHELFTLMSPVGLADKVWLEFGTNRISIHCDHLQVPCDKTNLAFRAASAFFTKTGIGDGVGVTIKKNIPVAGGLGGGSSNAAAVLKGLNRHYQCPLSRSQLHGIAASIGADVPFFLYEAPALATGIGDILTPYPLLGQMPVIIINPLFSVSTAEIYKSYSLGLTNGKKPIKYSSFTEKTTFDARLHLANDLEKVTAGRYPEIDRAKRRLKDHGATGTLMSGSGPSVFGIYSDARIARRAYRALCKSRNENIYLTELLTGDDAATE